MEEQQIIERIDKFLDKEGLDIQSKFILTKKINEEYWEEVLSEGEEEPEQEEDILGDFEEELEQEELADPKDIAEIQRKELEQRKRDRIKKKKIYIKKPKIGTKKEIKNPVEEDEIL